MFLYTGINIPEIICLGGGPAEPKDQTFLKSGTAWGACWRLFSLLGASWLHLVGLAAFFVGLGRFLCVLPRPGPGFWRVSGGSGHGFKGLRASFSEVFSRPRAFNATRLLMCKNHSFSKVFLMF